MERLLQRLVRRNKCRDRAAVLSGSESAQALVSQAFAMKTDRPGPHRPLLSRAVHVVFAHVTVNLHGGGGARRIDGVDPVQARAGPVDVAAVRGQRGLISQHRQQRS